MYAETGYYYSSELQAHWMHLIYTKSYTIASLYPRITYIELV